MAKQESLEDEIEREYANSSEESDRSEDPESKKENRPTSSGKIGGGKFFVLAIVGALVESVMAGLSMPTLLIWALIASIIGYPFFLKVRKSKRPDMYVYGTIFFSSAVFSVIGIVAVYMILREKGLTE